MYGRDLQRLIQFLSRLPGVGPRSARRLSAYLIKRKDQILVPFIDILSACQTSCRTCSQCFALDSDNPCSICNDTRRDMHILCLVADVLDLWALERSEVFRGRYHILGGILSAVDGVTPKDLRIPELMKRLETEGIEELILALPPSVDGQMTQHYLLGKLKPYSINITTLGQGVPMGGEFDFLDTGTLTAAFRSRQEITTKA